MNILERLRQVTRNNSNNYIQVIHGSWVNIIYKPDLFSSDQFGIGVGFIDENDILHTIFSDDFTGLTCFYKNNIDLEDIKFLADIAFNEYNGKKFNNIINKQISPQIYFSERSYASGQSINEILDNLYQRTIYLRSKEIKRKSSNTYGISENQFRKEIIDWVASKDKILATEIFPDNSNYIVKIENNNNIEQHILDLPIRKYNNIGASMTSICCGLQTAENRLLKGAMNISTASRFLEKNNEKAAFFILRSDERSKLSESELNHYEDILDQNTWKLRAAKIHVEVESSIPKLGSRILDYVA